MDGMTGWIHMSGIGFMSLDEVDPDALDAIIHFAKTHQCEGTEAARRRREKREKAWAERARLKQLQTPES